MYSIGLDVGGTNIAGGILSPSGEIVGKKSLPFPGANQPEASISIMLSIIDTLLTEAGVALPEIDGIGVAVPGSINYEENLVIDAHNLGYHQFPLVALLKEHLPGIPVYIENDANAAALAEYYCGAFKGYGSGLLITLGTGVGGGLILDHKLFVGGKKNGFEFGHGIMVFGGERCTCGNLGCIESYCSATALIREGRRAAEKNPQCLIAKRCEGDLKKIDAKLVIDCAKEKDPVAEAVFADYVAHLGAAISTAIAMFDPEVIAIGGGISYAGEFLFEPVREYVKPRSFFHNFARIVPAQMRNDAGIVGAGMLHRQRPELA